MYSWILIFIHPNNLCLIIDVSRLFSKHDQYLKKRKCKHIYLRERHRLKKATKHIVLTIWYSRKDKMTETANESGGARGKRKEERVREAARVWERVRLLCMNTIAVGMCYSSKLTAHAISTANPDLNQGFYVIMIWQYMVLNYNRSISLVWGFHSVGGKSMVG